MDPLKSVALKLFKALKPDPIATTFNSLEDLPFSVQIKRKAYQRQVSFKVDLKGVLKITAGQSLSEKKIFKFIKPHLSWIFLQEKKQNEFKKNFPPKIWRNGEEFLLNGKPIRMKLLPKEKRKQALIRFHKNYFDFEFPKYWETLEDKELHKLLHKKILSSFKKKTSESLTKKVSFWSSKMNLTPSKLNFRNQKARWGSCSSKGQVILNWKIGCLDEEIQDYVIVHELSHLKHHDHSQNFWKLVESFIPNRKELTIKLHNKSYALDCFLPHSELYEFNPQLPSKRLQTDTSHIKNTIL